MRELDPRKLAEEIADLKAAVRDLQLAGRLAHSSVEGGVTEVYDDDDTLRQVVGLQEDGTYTTRDVNGPASNEPAVPTVEAHPGLLVISSYGLTADGSDWPLDVRRLNVHVGTSEGFVLSVATKVGQFSTEGGVLSLALEPGDYWVALTAENTSGVESGVAGYNGPITVTAPATGAGGVATYEAPTEPVGLGLDDEGALWFDTSNGNRVNRWNGADWVPFRVGSDAIEDDAVEGRHVGRGQIDPRSLIVSQLGGPWANLIHDPSFNDAALRAERIAGADEPQWTFKQNVFFEAGGSPWIAGPAVTAAYDTNLGLQFTPNGIGADGVIWSYTSPEFLDPIETDIDYAVNVERIWPENGCPDDATYHVLFEWLDASDAVVGSQESATTDFTYESVIADNPFAEIVLTSAPATAVKLRVKYVLDSVVSLGVPAGTWTAAEPMLYVYPNGDDPLNATTFYMSRYGHEIGQDEWFLEADVPLGTSPTTRINLTGRFPVDPGKTYTPYCWTQGESDDPTYEPTGGVSFRFYDADGNTVQETGTSIAFGGTNRHPEWEGGKSEALLPPQNAVEAEVYAHAGPFFNTPGKLRVRLPYAAVSGWVDPGTKRLAYMTPVELRFGSTGSSSGELFRVVVNQDDDTASIDSAGTWSHRGGGVTLGSEPDKGRYTALWVDGAHLYDLADGEGNPRVRLEGANLGEPGWNEVALELDSGTGQVRLVAATEAAGSRTFVVSSWDSETGMRLEAQDDSGMTVDLKILSPTEFTDPVSLLAGVTVTGVADLQDALTVGGALTVAGQTSLQDTEVTGTLTVNGEVITPAGPGVPTGVRFMWGDDPVPAGYVLLDGSVLNIADHPDLAALYGTRYGGDGVTTFGVPDMRDVFPVGASGTKAADSTGGSESTTMPDHVHPIPGQAGAGFIEVDGMAGGVNVVSYGQFDGHAHGGDTGAVTGTNPEIATIPPYLAVNFIVKD